MAHEKILLLAVIDIERGLHPYDALVRHMSMSSIRDEAQAVISMIGLPYMGDLLKLDAECPPDTAAVFATYLGIVALASLDGCLDASPRPAFALH